MYVKKFIFSKFAGLQAYSRQLYYQMNSFTGIFWQHLKPPPPPILLPCIDLGPLPIKFWRASSSFLIFRIWLYRKFFLFLFFFLFTSNFLFFSRVLKFPHVFCFLLGRFWTWCMKPFPCSETLRFSKAAKYYLFKFPCELELCLRTVDKRLWVNRGRQVDKRDFVFTCFCCCLKI